MVPAVAHSKEPPTTNPLLPDSATLIIAVGNITALGKPLNDTNVHRPEVFSELTGVGLDQTITPRAFATAIAKGSLGKSPAGVRQAALITGAQPGRRMSESAVVTRELWRLGVKNVVLSFAPRRNTRKSVEPLIQDLT